MLTRIFDRLVGGVNCCPWVGHAYGLRPEPVRVKKARPPYLYSPAERRRRDATPWTMVQGILAPVQFLVFLVSLGFVLHYLIAGTWFEAATISVLVKTTFLITIMVTGAIWEYEVFGQYLFAPAFFWEDVFSFAVIALHSIYVVVLLTGFCDARAQMMIALAAYTAYVINATQFVMKLRMARRETPVAVSTQVMG
jgi:3-vinyl bacteriochlorophyllide hydratase